MEVGKKRRVMAADMGQLKHSLPITSSLKTPPPTFISSLLRFVPFLKSQYWRLGRSLRKHTPVISTLKWNYPPQPFKKTKTNKKFLTNTAKAEDGICFQVKKNLLKDFHMPHLKVLNFENWFPLKKHTRTHFFILPVHHWKVYALSWGREEPTLHQRNRGTQCKCG